MTFYVDNETPYEINDELQKKIEEIVLEVTKEEQFLYPFEVNLLITDNNGIKEFNTTYRKINKETDVLSFPNLDFEIPGNYDVLENEIEKINYYNLDTDEVVLGDIIISYEKIISQANEYGHSETRELCFLIAHSMLHLLGYDHMEPDEAKVMEEKQKKILDRLGITKDIS